MKGKIQSIFSESKWNTNYFQFSVVKTQETTGQNMVIKMNLQQTNASRID